MGNIKMMAEEKESQKQLQWSFSLQLVLFIQSLLPNFLFSLGILSLLETEKQREQGERYTTRGFRSESSAQPTN